MILNGRKCYLLLSVKSSSFRPSCASMVFSTEISEEISQALVDKKAVQQFFECNVQGINRLFDLCLCAADVIAGNRLFVKFPVGVQQFGCSWQIIIHHFLQIRCNFRMNPYLIKDPLHQLFHFVQFAGNFFSRNVVIAFPDMTDIGLTFVDQLLAFIRYFVFFLFLFYDFFLFVIFQTCAAVVLISLIGKQEVIVLRIHMCFVKSR